MTKWRDPTFTIHDDDQPVNYYPKQYQWKLILGGMVALNIIAALTIGGVV